MAAISLSLVTYSLSLLSSPLYQKQATLAKALEAMPKFKRIPIGAAPAVKQTKKSTDTKTFIAKKIKVITTSKLALSLHCVAMLAL